MVTCEFSNTVADTLVVLKLAKLARVKVSLTNGAKLAATNKIMQDTFRRRTAMTKPANIHICAIYDPEASKPQGGHAWIKTGAFMIRL
jgi:hypothetical protein